MTYFADGTRYSYAARWPGCDNGEAINVGWLAGSHPFPHGETSRELVTALCELGRYARVNQMRGWHQCELCVGTMEGYRYPAVAPCEDPYPVGDCEIRVPAPYGAMFAAPNLIAHYVAAHGYRPPDAFVAAAIRAAAELARNSSTTS